ncbi:hypothetical protein, partial [Rugosimonospora africana]|uniref:hypothetical protein n=1 Tax=Rugosimonospora africana TaxID=556532 RepID=UPI0019425046
MGRGADATWIGKRTLLNSNQRGSDWYGFRVVSPEHLSPSIGYYHLSRQEVPEMAPADPSAAGHSDAYASGEPDTRAGPDEGGSYPLSTEPEWFGDGRSLTGEQNRYADDVLLNSTFNDEGIRGHLDSLSDHHVVHARTPGNDPDGFKARFADAIAGSGPGQSLEQSAEDAGTTLRYEIDLPDSDYASGAQRVIDGLVARGYEPVRVDGWTADRPGVESQWRDPDTGQVFDVSLDTAGSHDTRLILDRLDNDLAKNLDPEQRAHLETLRADTVAAVHT